MIPLKVGLIVDGSTVSAAIRDFVTISGTSPSYRFTKLIRLPSAGGRPGTLASTVFRGVEVVETTLLARLLGYGPLLETVPTATLGLESVDPAREVSADGLPVGTSAGTPVTWDLDLVVNPTGRTIPESVVSATRLGALHVRLGERPTAPTGPRMFDEVRNHERSTRFSVVLQSPGTSLPFVLATGKVPTAPMFVLNRAKTERKVVFVLRSALERFAATIGSVGGSGTDGMALSDGKGGSGTTDRPKPPGTSDDREPGSGPVDHAFPVVPRTSASLSYGLDVAGRVAIEALRKLTRKDVRWSVGFMPTGDWRTADLSRLTTILNPPGHFLADPFIHRMGTRVVCFVEDFDYASGKGVITAYDLSEDGYRALGTVLDEPFHLSYPYVFEVDGRLYMCPETHSRREIRLYRCEEFPTRWQLHKVVMSDVSAAETNFHRVGDRWWMFTNMDTSDLSDHDSELHLYHADAFDSDEWTPHEANPVIFDPASARNGGSIVDESGGLFRVFQQRGFGQYGEAVGVTRISTLGPAAYEESLERFVDPTFFDGLGGAHTFSYHRGWLTVDFSRVEPIHPAGSPGVPVRTTT